MKNAVQILLEFSDTWQDMEINSLLIRDFEKATEVIKILGILNVKLRQDNKEIGGTVEWNNL